MDKYQLLIQAINQKIEIANNLKTKQPTIINEKSQETAKKNQDLKILEQEITMAKERFEICRDFKKILRENKKIFSKAVVKISLIVLISLLLIGFIALSLFPAVGTALTLIIAAISIEGLFLFLEHKSFKASNEHIKRVCAETNKEELHLSIIKLEKEKEQLVEYIMKLSYEKEFAEKMIENLIAIIKNAEEVKREIIGKRTLELENNAQKHEFEINAAFDKDPEILKLALKIQNKK